MKLPLQFRHYLALALLLLLGLAVRFNVSGGEQAGAAAPAAVPLTVPLASTR